MGVATSIVLGAILGAGLAAVSGIALVAAGRTLRAARWVGAGFAIGSSIRMSAALAGIVLGLLLRPPSVAGFVLAFLISYLAGQGLVAFGIGRKAPGGEPGRGPQEE